MVTGNEITEKVQNSSLAAVDKLAEQKTIGTGAETAVVNCGLTEVSHSLIHS